MRREQVVRCLSTTMTIKDWCALNGVPQSTMYGWMSRFRKEEPELFESPSSGEWIELSREAVSARTALATRPDCKCQAVFPLRGKHFFLYLGKMIFPWHGKHFFPADGKQFFPRTVSSFAYSAA